MRTSLAVAAALAACVSCSLFTSLSGFSSGTGEPLADGGDGDAADTTGVDGGSGDGGGDGGGGRSCAMTDATICTDFDEPDALAPWTVSTEGDGTVTVVPSGFSPPNALESKASFATGSPQAEARITKELTGVAVKRSRIHYRFRFEQVAPGAAMPFGQIDMTANGSRASVRFFVRDLNGEFEGAIYPDGAGGSFPTVKTGITFQLAAWYTAEIFVDWESAPARVTLDLDGVRLADGFALTGAVFGPGTLKVHPGIYYLRDGPGTARVLFDDVAVWIE